MSYNIYKSDGTIIVVENLINDQSFNDPTANGGKGIGIQFAGFMSENYVVPIAQNFLQITENFAGATLPSDSKALLGQLWFNKTSSILYVRTVDSLTGGISNWEEILSGNTTVTPGSYTSPTITINSQGRITSASSGLSAVGVPYFVPLGETFIIPVNHQALFTMPIDIEGSLEVDGYLIEI
jgi:hypothetical protein